MNIRFFFCFCVCWYCSSPQGWRGPPWLGGCFRLCRNLSKQEAFLGNFVRLQTAFVFTLEKLFSDRLWGEKKGGVKKCFILKGVLKTQLCTMRVSSPWGFSEMTIQPARHEYHVCCLLRAEFMAFQPVADNTRGTRVEEVVSSFQKIFRGSQLTVRRES